MESCNASSPPFPCEDGQEDGTSKEFKVKRPMNAFMLWSKEKRRQISKIDPGLHNAQISKILGEEWKLLSKEEKQPYIEESKKLMAQHKIDHPDYHYKPRQNKFNKSLQEINSFPMNMSIHDNMKVSQYSTLHSKLKIMQHRPRYIPYPDKPPRESRHDDERWLESVHGHIIDPCHSFSRTPPNVRSPICSCHPYLTVMPRSLPFSCCRREDHLMSSHRVENILDCKREIKPRKPFPLYGISIPNLVVRSDDSTTKRLVETKSYKYNSSKDLSMERQKVIIVDM